MTPLNKKRVLIGDSQALLAEGIASLLSSEYEIVGMATSGRQLLNDAVRLSPDLIVLDIAMPELKGLEGINHLRTLRPLARLILLTQDVDPRCIRAAFRAGVRGCLAKQSTSGELLEALQQALLGETYMSSVFQKALGLAPVSELLTLGSDAANSLTGRQRQVLQLVAEGKTAKQISSRLEISPKTVEFHKKSLMNETGLRTTAELTRYAIAHGIVSL